MNQLEIIKNKIQTKESYRDKLAYLKFKDKKIVFTNGVFDILHAGHIEYLSKASDLGDVLIIGMNTDSSVKRIKGDNRPINNQEARGLQLASLRFVEDVIYFDEDTPYDLIEFLQPDVLVKGADYKHDQIVGADIIKAKGGVVTTIDFVDGFSTTKLIEKIKNT
jgi:rfaE bifunctional protein nucleotidyltransferase chain/domain